MGLASKRRVISATMRMTIKPLRHDRRSKQSQQLIVRWIGARARRDAASDLVQIREICRDNIVVLKWSETFGRP